VGVVGPGTKPYFPGTLRAALVSAYGFSFLSQACDLGFYLVLFKFVPLAGVGEFSWVMAVMVFVGLILDLGISPALTREFSQHRTAMRVVLRHASLLRLPGLAVSLILFLAWIVAKKPQSHLEVAMLLAGAGLAVRTCTGVLTAWLYSEERQPEANLMGALSSAGRLVAGFGLILVARCADIGWLFAALLVVELLGWVTAWALCHRVVEGRTRPRIASQPDAGSVTGVHLRLRAVGISFGLITVLMACQNRLDWLLVTHFLSVKALALYSMANKCWEVARTAVGLALSSVFPWMCRERGAVPPGLKVFYKALLVGSGFIALAGALVGPELLSLIWGSKYAGSETAVRLLMASAAAAALCSMLYLVLIANGSERFIIWATTVATSIQVGLDVILIPRWGIAGAVAGMLALLAVVFVLYTVRLWPQLKTLGLYWTLYPLLPMLAGALVMHWHLSLWPRAALGLCFWLVASAFPLHGDYGALFELFRVKSKLANE
jgi:O-antigen/teichoic acid export membrane protein